MATTFKTFANNDITSTRTLLHESIPITGSIVSGTYNEGGTTTETNIKNFSHGLFQSVYDYSYLSSSANHIFDITVGYSNSSNFSGSSNVQNADKINIYNQMAQILMGHDATGSIREFDEDGDISAGGNKLREVFFINFARLLNKDEIKKGTFSLELGVSGSTNGSAANIPTFNKANKTNELVFLKKLKIADLSGSTSYLVNSPAGDYGVLYATSSGNNDPLFLENEEVPVGLIFYQAGIAVISGSVFSDDSDGGRIKDSAGTVGLGNPVDPNTAGSTGFTFVTGSSISGSADAIRNRIYNISFNNTTELNSTIYFCRASHNEFNYSSNPTYLSSHFCLLIKLKDDPK